MRILIAEEGQHVISAVRLMRKMGHTVFLATTRDDRINRVTRSRRIESAFVIDKPSSDREWIASIKNVYDRENMDVFFPFGFKLVTAYMESSRSERDMVMRTPYSGYDSYWDLSDKHRLYDLCSNLKINMPKLFGEGSIGCVPRIDKKEFPVIVKATRGKGILGNVILAGDQDEMMAFIEGSTEGSRFIIQQYIPGDVFDVGGFSVDGKIVFNVPQRRTVTYPLRGGVAAVNDIFPDEKLLEMTRRIIERSGWTGPFQSEFRYDPAAGDYYLIEVNAKMWGSTQLTLRSNPRIIKIALDTALGKDVSSDLDFKTGLRQRWLVQEIYALRFGSFPDWIEFLGRFLRPSGYDLCISDIFYDLHRYLGALKTILFRPSDLPKPLIDRRTHKKLNQIL